MPETPDDLQSRVTSIPNGSDGDDKPGDEKNSADKAPIEIALPRVPSSPDLSNPELSGQTGESPVVSEVRDRTQAVLAFGELELPGGQGPDDEVQIHPDPVQPFVVVEEEVALEEESKVPLSKDFEKAILEHFGDLADKDTKSVYLDFGRFDVCVLGDRILVSSSVELGDADAVDSYNQPEIKKIIEELFRAEALCTTLIDKNYHVFRRGQTADGYYEVILRRGIVFETKEDLIGYLDYLKGVLEVVNSDNMDEDGD